MSSLRAPSAQAQKYARSFGLISNVEKYMRNGTSAKHLLLTFDLMKNYNRVRTLAARYNMHTDTLKYYVDRIAFYVSQLKYKYIVWANRFDGEVQVDRRFSANEPDLTVDGTDFYRQENTLIFDPELFSEKFRGPGYRYQMVRRISNGYIVRIDGPFKCGLMTDLLQ